jgi:hypothetical protein
MHSACQPPLYEVMEIRAARPQDAPAIWAILEPTIRAGETFALPRDMTQTEAIIRGRGMWMRS